MNHYFYICDICEYQYDEEDTGMTWEQLPKDWTCINCEASKKSFKLIEVSNAFRKDQTAIW